MPDDVLVAKVETIVDREWFNAVKAMEETSRHGGSNELFDFIFSAGTENIRTAHEGLLAAMKMLARVAHTEVFLRIGRRLDEDGQGLPKA